MGTFVALYDACVLYPAPLRDLLLQLAVTDLFAARWTDEIHEEWIEALLRTRPELENKLPMTRTLMNMAVPDCLVTGYEGLADSLVLPDQNDRHVVAAAIRCQAGVIVTLNLRDFPKSVLDPYGIDVQHPDEFVSHLFDLAPGPVCAAVKRQRLSLTRPPRSIQDLLSTFLSLGLVNTVASLQPMSELL